MVDTPCIEWPNGKTTEGYGSKWVDGKDVYVHRWVIEQIEGPLLPGEVVKHKCDNPSCFRYDHLERGSYSENLQEAWDRGQRGPCYQLSKTQCPQGHEYSEENTYVHVDKKGTSRRHCKECRREANRRWSGK